MKDKNLEQRIQHSLNAELSGLRTSAWQREQFYRNATGGNKVKRKITYSMALVMALVLIAVAALAVALLTPKEIVEQVAVPMAQENDREWRVTTDFTPDELAAFIRACNENGIDLDENHAIMEAIRSGQGYNEEEAIMAVCRVAFGGNYGEWTIAERHWFQDMMVSIGWAHENHELLPGPDDLSEEEAKERLMAAIRAEYGEELPLEDSAQFAVSISYYPADEENAAWTLTCHPRQDGAEAYYTASLSRAGEVLDVQSVDYGRSQTLEERGYAFRLTEEEAVHLAADAIRSRTGKDVPLEDPEKYHSIVYRTKDPLGWQVDFISHTADWGRCSAHVNDATGEAAIAAADVGDITADNILTRYRSQNGWYDGWDSGVWAEIASRSADLPAETLEGRVVKATPWIAWREGLLSRDEAEERAFRQAGVRLGDVNCASLIDALPDPVWKFRLLPWDDSYQDSIVVEIDAVTGEMLDLDMYKSDHADLEPSYHMITLRRIWSQLETAENGPLPVARLAVLHRFADLSYDMPEIDDIPIYDLRFWQPEIRDRTVRFRSQWSDFPDYEVELDVYNMAVRVEEKESSGMQPMPDELRQEAGSEAMYLVDGQAFADAQQTYGTNDYTWPLEVQAAVYAGTERTVPRPGEMTLEQAVAFATAQLPQEAGEYAAGSTVGVLCQRLDAGLPTEKLRWMVYFMADPGVKEGWRVTFLDAGEPDHASSIEVHEPGDTGNG